MFKRSFFFVKCGTFGRVFASLKDRHLVIFSFLIYKTSSNDFYQYVKYFHTTLVMETLIWFPKIILSVKLCKNVNWWTKYANQELALAYMHFSLIVFHHPLSNQSYCTKVSHWTRYFTKRFAQRDEPKVAWQMWKFLE